MSLHKSSLKIISFKDLDRELIVRGSQSSDKVQFKFQDLKGTPQRHAIMNEIIKLYTFSYSFNHALKHISTKELIGLIKLKIQEENFYRGIWEKDDRMDIFGLIDENTKQNVNVVAAICQSDNLSSKRNGFAALKTKEYRTVFNLCSDEPFCHQPIATGRMCTGILVKEDVIATAGHCANENNVRNLRIVFGYKMLGASTAVTWIPNDDIYKGTEIIGRSYNPPNGADWALVKLDRKVSGHPVAKLSDKTIYPGQQLYILGHPCGLPLKYSAGSRVCGVHDSYFSADLNVYCGNSGSPVFDRETHEVVGLVARGDSQDFRWTGKGWMSIIYPNPVFRSQEPQCTRVSEFINYCS